MSDRTYRDLERRAQASGSAEDEAALLRARLHAGTIDRARLGVLAYLRYPPAKLLVAPTSPDDPILDPPPISRLASGPLIAGALRAFGHVWPVAAAAAFAQAWRDVAQDRDPDPHAARCIDVAWKWVRAGGPRSPVERRAAGVPAILPLPAYWDRVRGSVRYTWLACGAGTRPRFAEDAIDAAIADAGHRREGALRARASRLILAEALRPPAASPRPKPKGGRPRG